MKILIVRLYSCGVNYQSDYIENVLESHYQLTEYFDDADAIVMLGGCCCSDENLYNTLMQIRTILTSKREGAKTYLTGCITRGFKDIDEYKKLESVLNDKIDFVVDHYEPNELLDLIRKQDDNVRFDLTFGYGICQCSDIQGILYLQNGCTHNCSFCKSNYIECNLMDMPIEKAKRFIDEIDARMIEYLQLRGLNISQYGLGLYGKPRLMELLEYIETKNNIKHVELGGMALSDAIKLGFADKLRYLKKVDLINTSLESGSDRLLKLMNKGFTMEEFWEFFYQVNSIDKKDFYLSIISGFPTETIEECHETLRVIKNVRPKLVNINTFLPSFYTPANDLEKLSEEEIDRHTKLYTKTLKKSHIRTMVNLSK